MKRMVNEQARARVRIFNVNQVFPTFLFIPMQQICVETIYLYMYICSDNLSFAICVYISWLTLSIFNLYENCLLFFSSSNG